MNVLRPLISIYAFEETVSYPSYVELEAIMLREAF